MKILKIIFFTILLSSNVIAGMNYFNEGLTLYNNKELDKAKFKFEQDIVFNPKNERSYLYLSKIFNEQKKKRVRVYLLSFCLFSRLVVWLSESG